MAKRKDNICFEYEKLFGFAHSVGGIVMQDLMNNFSHACGAFVADDPSSRLTNYKLGQQSVINYIMAQINAAQKKSEKENNA